MQNTNDIKNELKKIREEYDDRLNELEKERVSNQEKIERKI